MILSTKYKFFDSCNVYILLWIILHVQNLFLNSSLVSMIFYIPFLGMTVYYVVKVFLIHPKGVMRALSVFFLMLVAYGVGLLILNNALGQARHSFIKMVLSSLGPIFVFYSFTKQGLLTEKRMLSWLLFFLAVATIEYYVHMQNNLNLMLEQGMDREEATNSTAYIVLGLMPFVFLLRKKVVLQYLFIGYIMYFVVSGLKRGAMLTGLVMLIWFVYVVTKSNTKIIRIGSLILTLVLCIIGYYYVMKFYETSDYFQLRVENTLEGNSSNRDFIYSTLWNHYLSNENIVQLAFGEGAFHTETLIGLKAHNDWLELLIDCGLFGVIVYAVYWISFVVKWIRSKSDYLVYAMLGSCFIFLFLRTLFSMSFSNVPFYISVVIGYCFACPCSTSSNNKIQNEDTCIR